MAGYEDINDAERLCVDPAMRQVVGERAKDETAGSVSQMGRFETEILTQPQNLKVLMNHPGQWVDKVHQRKPIKEIILDMDSSDSPTFGRQEGSAYNGHFGYTCYHPLFLFNQFGDIERALLRHGNVYSSDNWKSVLEPVVGRYRDENLIRYFRGDAAFADPNIYCFLEAEDYFYAIRLKGNNILYRHIEDLLTRPVGRPPRKPIVLYESFQYRAASWHKSRRVVAKIEWHAGELFPRIGFIVTNLRRKSSNVVKFYNKRGTAEQGIKEGKYAVGWTRMSCRRGQLRRDGDEVLAGQLTRRGLGCRSVHSSAEGRPVRVPRPLLRPQPGRLGPYPGKYARLVTRFAETAEQSHSNGPAMALGTGQMGNVG